MVSGGLSRILTRPGTGVLAMTMTVPGIGSATSLGLGQAHGDECHRVGDLRLVDHGDDVIEGRDLAPEQLGVIRLPVGRGEVAGDVEAGGPVDHALRRVLPDRVSGSRSPRWWSLGAQRGHGVGQQLVTAEDHARAEGADTLMIVVLVSNERAEAFYRDAGYRRPR